MTVQGYHIWKSYLIHLNSSLEGRKSLRANRNENIRKESRRTGMIRQTHAERVTWEEHNFGGSPETAHGKTLQLKSNETR